MLRRVGLLAVGGTIVLMFNGAADRPSSDAGGPPRVAAVTLDAVLAHDIAGPTFDPANHSELVGGTLALGLSLYCVRRIAI